MNIFMKDKKIYIKNQNKILELASEETLSKLNSKKWFIKKINELTMKYATIVSTEIDKMDLEGNEKIIAEIIVMEKLNNATMHALGEICKDIGECKKDVGEREECKENVEINDYIRDKIKDDDETLKCFSKVLEKMGDNIEKCAKTVRKDIPKGDPSILYDKEKLIRDVPALLFTMCKLGRGKAISDFMEKTMLRCAEETNRLGRPLTREEVIEICDDIRHKRR